MAEIKKAIIYARVSTTRQADDGLPIESQIEHGHRKAQAIGAIVVREFIDAGISGRTDERPAFQDAVSYCKAYGIDFFICWSTSRFARNKLDASLYKRDLEKCGTRVQYVSVDLDNRTDSGWMMESILEIFDEHYSRQVSADTLRSMVKNARDGFFNGGRPPFGYSPIKDGKRTRLMVNEAEAVVVRDMFRYYLSGLGCKSIAVLLNKQGVLNRAKKWSKNTVANMLKSDVYTGNVVFGRKSRSTGKTRQRDEWIITKSHEAIISEEDFMTALSLFGDRAPSGGTGSPHSRFVFTGILQCEKCGSALQIETATGRSKTYAYYNCRSSLKGLGCVSRRIAADDLDQWLIDVIMSKILTREMLEESIKELRDLTGEWVKDREKRRAGMVSDLRTTENRLRNLYEVLELHGKDAPNLGDLTIRIRELRTQRDNLESSIVRLEDEPMPTVLVTNDEITEMAELMRDIVATTTDGVKLRQFFSSMIDKIVIGDEEARIYYNTERIMNRASVGTVHSDAVWLPEMVLLRTKSVVAKMPAAFFRRAA